MATTTAPSRPGPRTGFGSALAIAAGAIVAVVALGLLVVGEVYRVIAYAALMRDQYPPFRLGR